MSEENLWRMTEAPPKLNQGLRSMEELVTGRVESERRVAKWGVRAVKNIAEVLTPGYCMAADVVANSPDMTESEAVDSRMVGIGSDALSLVALAMIGLKVSGTADVIPDNILGIGVEFPELPMIPLMLSTQLTRVRIGEQLARFSRFNSEKGGMDGVVGALQSFSKADALSGLEGIYKRFTRGAGV